MEMDCVCSVVIIIQCSGQLANWSLEVNLISDVNMDNWTTDEHTNALVLRMVKSYNIKRNEINGDFKRERFTLEVGDELPAGIVQLAKVYIAKKRKLKAVRSGEVKEETREEEGANFRLQTLRTPQSAPGSRNRSSEARHRPPRQRQL